MIIDIVSFSRICSAVQVVVNVVLYINSPLPATFKLTYAAAGPLEPLDLSPPSPQISARI